MLRKRIAELQQYRKLGLSTAADIKKWEEDLYKRVGYVSWVNRLQYSEILRRKPRQICHEIQRDSSSFGLQVQGNLLGPILRGATAASASMLIERVLTKQVPLDLRAADPVRIRLSHHCSLTHCPLSNSGATEPRKQSFPPSPHTRRANSLLVPSHPTQTVSGYQRDSCAGVRSPRWQATATRSTRPCEDRRE